MVSSDKAMEILESVVSAETSKKFERRYEEGYDVEGDEFYAVWCQLKALTIEDTTSEACSVSKPIQTYASL